MLLRSSLSPLWARRLALPIPLSAERRPVLRSLQVLRPPRVLPYLTRICLEELSGVRGWSEDGEVDQIQMLFHAYRRMVSST
jgi:hypothetical protein